jgi:hypothetical protein
MLTSFNNIKNNNKYEYGLCGEWKKQKHAQRYKGVTAQRRNGATA